MPETTTTSTATSSSGIWLPRYSQPIPQGPCRKPEIYSRSKQVRRPRRWTYGPWFSGKAASFSSRSRANGVGPCLEAGQTWGNPRPRLRPARRWRSRATGCGLSGCSRPVRLLAAYDRDRHAHPPIPYHVYKLVYFCEILDSAPLTDVDTHGARFFGEHEIPELSVTRVTRAQISRFFEQHRYPALPADFD
jgi:hypothetical protein